MTLRKAKNYLSMYFDLNSEAYSCFQDITPDGVFTKNDIIKFDSETTINVAQDIEYQVRCEIGYLI